MSEHKTIEEQDELLETQLKKMEEYVPGTQMIGRYPNPEKGNKRVLEQSPPETSQSKSLEGPSKRPAKKGLKSSKRAASHPGESMATPRTTRSSSVQGREQSTDDQPRASRATDQIILEETIEAPTRGAEESGTGGGGTKRGGEKKRKSRSRTRRSSDHSDDADVDDQWRDPQVIEETGYTVSQSIIDYMLDNDKEPPCNLQAVLILWRDDEWEHLKNPPDELTPGMYLCCLKSISSNKERLAKFQRATNHLTMAQWMKDMSCARSNVTCGSTSLVVPYPMAQSQGDGAECLKAISETMAKVELINKNMADTSIQLRRDIDLHNTVVRGGFTDMTQSLHAKIMTTMDTVKSTTVSYQGLAPPSSTPSPTLSLPGPSTSGGHSSFATPTAPAPRPKTPRAPRPMAHE